MRLSHCKGAKGTRHKTVVEVVEAKAFRTSSYLIIFLIVFCRSGALWPNSPNNPTADGGVHVVTALVVGLW